jgi:hypothetical protein
MACRLPPAPRARRPQEGLFGLRSWVDEGFFPEGFFAGGAPALGAPDPGALPLAGGPQRSRRAGAAPQHRVRVGTAAALQEDAAAPGAAGDQAAAGADAGAAGGGVLVAAPSPALGFAEEQQPGLAAGGAHACGEAGQQARAAPDAAVAPPRVLDSDGWGACRGGREGAVSKSSGHSTESACPGSGAGGGSNTGSIGSKAAGGGEPPRGSSSDAGGAGAGAAPIGSGAAGAGGTRGVRVSTSGGTVRVRRPDPLFMLGVVALGTNGSSGSSGGGVGGGAGAGGVPPAAPPQRQGRCRPRAELEVGDYDAGDESEEDQGPGQAPGAWGGARGGGSCDGTDRGSGPEAAGAGARQAQHPPAAPQPRTRRPLSVAIPGTGDADEQEHAARTAAAPAAAVRGGAAAAAAHGQPACACLGTANPTRPDQGSGADAAGGGDALGAPAAALGVALAAEDPVLLTLELEQLQRLGSLPSLLPVDPTSRYAAVQAVPEWGSGLVPQWPQTCFGVPLPAHSLGSGAGCAGWGGRGWVFEPWVRHGRITGYRVFLYTPCLGPLVGSTSLMTLPPPPPPTDVRTASSRPPAASTMPPACWQRPPPAGTWRWPRCPAAAARPAGLTCYT